MTSKERYELPELGYKYDDLEPVISSETLGLHHDKHHAAYVSGANKALDDLAGMRGDGEFDKAGQLHKTLAFHLSGHILHSIFWCNMSPNGGGSPQGPLSDAIKRAFGSEDALREEMSHAATSIQGSGWAALCREPVTRELVVQQIHDHQSTHVNGSMPLLVLDMWEHAFYLQYRTDKKKWVTNFWDIVNWNDVGRRFESAEPMNLRLVA